MFPTGNGLNEFARRLIRRKARQLVGRAGLRSQDVADIEQEITARLLRGLQRFDPNHAALDAFVSHLVDNAIAILLRDRRAAKRWPPAGTGPAAPVEHVPDETDACPVREWELRVDVAALLAGLSHDARAVAERLMAGDSKADAARALGRKRTTLYREVYLMRAAFERGSLRKYL